MGDLFSEDDMISDHRFIVARLREMLDAYEAEAGSADYHLMVLREYRRVTDGKGITLKLGVSWIEPDDC